MAKRAKKKEAGERRSPRSLAGAVDAAAGVASEIAFESFELTDEERREAEHAFEVLVALADAMEFGSARALGALRSGARTARKWLPTLNADPEADLEREVVALISTRGPPGGVALHHLSVVLAVRLRARSAILPRAGVPGDQHIVADAKGKRRDITSTFSRFVGLQDTEALELHEKIVSRALRRFAVADRVFVANAEHRDGASPRKGQKLCRCPPCVASRIVLAARRALAK